MSEVALGKGKGVIAGDNVTTKQIPLVADTYFIGMRLEYDAVLDAHKLLAASTLAAIYHGTDGRVLSGTGVDDCIVGGDIAESGIKDDTGAAISTLTEDEKAAYRDAGFFVKDY